MIKHQLPQWAFIRAQNKTWYYLQKLGLQLKHSQIESKFNNKTSITNTINLTNHQECQIAFTKINNKATHHAKVTT